MATSREEVKIGKADDFLVGGGEMAERALALDWSKTPVGPMAGWPQSLKTALSACLSSRYPIVIWWGNPAYTMFYNDAFIPILGVTKHPGWLGQSGRECWSEIWPTIGPMLEGVFATGEATWSEDLLLVMRRNLPREETYFTFSYSPIQDEAGAIGGIFCACYETTGRVIGERRLRTLRDLSRMVVEARTAEEACEVAARTLAENPADIPFALIYLLESESQHARLVAMTGIEAGSASAPNWIDLQASTDRSATWPLRRVLDTATAELVPDLTARYGPLPGGPWPEAPESALILPIAAPGQTRPTGFLVTGLSPRRVIDSDYCSFFDLIAGHVGAAIANARAYEDERRRAEALAEIDRAKTAFFSNVSHEFRTPLSLMLGPLEDTLAQTNGLPAADRERLEIAHRNSLRLLKLVNTLLDFSRIEAGRIQASYEPADLAALTAELSSVFRSAIERAGMRLVVNCQPLDEPVYVDREMWEKIVLNLLSNAFKFTFDGEIEVSLRREGDHAELTVRDTGAGIPADELPHLFERFHRVKGARGRTFESGGIGLALVQELVKLHGGTVRVESEVDCGSAFIVSIPLGKTHLPAGRIRAVRSLASTCLRGGDYVEEALRWLPSETERRREEETERSREEVVEKQEEARQSLSVSPSLHPSVTSSSARVLLADDNAGQAAVAIDNARLFAEAEKKIAQRKQAEAALRESEERFRTLADNAPVMIWVNGPTGCEFVNRECLEFLGVCEEDVLGHDWAQFIHPKDREDYVNAYLEAVSRRGRFEAEFRFRRRDGEYRWMRSVGAPRIEGGEYKGYVGISSDIHESRRAEETVRAAYEQESAARAEAEAANRSKDEFLAVVSHELRSPINAINGWVKLLREGQLDPDDVDKALMVIERNSLAQTRLVEDLLDTARIVTGKLRLELGPLDINPILADALDVAREPAAAKGVELRASYSQRPMVVTGDATRLQQIVWNLLSNAIKFTPEGGHIELRAERAKDHIRIIVSDTGEGIQPEFLPYVFDRFRQADSPSSQRHGGLGLGLALVKHLAELHGGKVEATSAGAGCGATFTATLPLATQSILGSAAPPALAVSDGSAPMAAGEAWSKDATPLPPGITIEGVRVLVVDDQEDARVMLSEFLTRYGAVVTTVSSGAEALAVLSDPPDGAGPDILICDIMMPKEDGYEVMRRVRALEAERGAPTSQQLPAIALTALAGSEDRVCALKAGFQSHVPKPVEPVELILVIASIVGLWRQGPVAN
jgi:PAS domain S-box-containing protein